MSKIRISRFEMARRGDHVVIGLEVDCPNGHVARVEGNTQFKLASSIQAHVDAVMTATRQDLADEVARLSALEPPNDKSRVEITVVLPTPRENEAEATV